MYLLRAAHHPLGSFSLISMPFTLSNTLNTSSRAITHASDRTLLSIPIAGYSSKSRSISSSPQYHRGGHRPKWQRVVQNHHHHGAVYLIQGNVRHTESVGHRLTQHHKACGVRYVNIITLCPIISQTKCQALHTACFYPASIEAGCVSAVST